MIKAIEPYRWKMLGGGSVVLAVLIVAGVFIPRIQQLTDMYAHLNKQQTKIESAENWEQKLAGFARQEEQLDTFFSDLSMSMSANDQMSTIVELVFKRARDAGVRIRRMRPQDQRVSDTFTEVPVSIRVEGGFHRIASFASGLEQTQQLIRVTRLSIQTPDEVRGTASPQLTADLVINVATLQPETENEHG